MRARDHARRRPLGRQHRTQRKAPANPLGHHHDVRRDPGPFMREKPPRAPHPALHLVQDQKRPRLVAERAQAAQAGLRHRPDAALALHRLDQDRPHIGRPDRRLERGMIPPGQLREARQKRAKALRHLLRPRRRDRRRRPAVERPREGQDPRPRRLALLEPVFARHLHGQFAGLGPRIGEKDGIREGQLHQHVGQPLLFGDLVDVGQMPDLARLRRQHLDQRRMGMAKRIHRDPRGKVEVPLARGGDEPGPLAPFKGQGRAVVGRQDRGDHRLSPGQMTDGLPHQGQGPQRAVRKEDAGKVRQAQARAGQRLSVGVGEGGGTTTSSFSLHTRFRKARKGPITAPPPVNCPATGSLAGTG